MDAVEYEEGFGSSYILYNSNLPCSNSNTIIAIAIPLVPTVARVVRSSTLSLREQPFVEAARAVGMGAVRVRLPGNEIVGHGEGVDERGRLLLRLADGSVQAVAAGDVFPLGGAMPVRASAPGRVD